MEDSDKQSLGFWRSLLVFTWEVLKILLVAAAIVIPVRYFLVQPFMVRGASMEPNFENGQYLIIDEITFRFRDPARGEAIVFRYPRDPSQFYIKRIVGLPNETITLTEEGEVLVKTLGADQSFILNEDSFIRPEQDLVDTEMSFTLGTKEYFVLGDNRGASSDSREWGQLPEKFIVGRAWLRAWPLTEFGVLPAPQESAIINR